MHTLRCIVAEWDVVRARLFHTRLGIWLVLLGIVFVWSAQDEIGLAPAAVRTGLFAGVLCVAFAAGAARDRAALETSLGHPTFPLALASGRWLAASVAAALAVIGVTLTLAIMRGAAAPAVLSAALAGATAAAAVTGCALPAVVAGGNAFAALLLVYFVAAGLMSTAGWRVSHVWLHAFGWPIGGVLATAFILARRR
jgi:hypothetical protein